VPANPRRSKAPPLPSLPELRRDGDVTVPAGPKARRTRAALLGAAKELFVANGYHNTSVADIAARAGVSLGTFYQYFRDRNDVLVAMLTRNLELIFEDSSDPWQAKRGRADVRRVVAAFVHAYANTADTVGVWEEVSHVDADMADLRRSLGHSMTQELEAELLRSGKQGLCRKFSPREAALAATALAAMVDRFCYVSFVFDPPDDGIDVEMAIDVLADLWSAAIGLVD
jgi:AcrR family transcriptional regulator